MVQELKATIALQEAQIKALTTSLKQQAETIIAEVQATNRKQQKQIEALTSALQKAERTAEK